MSTQQLDVTSPAVLREQLELLERERAAAALHGLAGNGLYMADLSDELEALRSAYVGAAVTEIASLRAELDGGSGKQLTALPLFARHDKGAGKKIKPITPTTGRNIVAERVRQALGNEAEGHITPHSFRHYFVSTILRASGNLKLAQALARHENIQITQRYAHINDDELDKGYSEIFEKKGSPDRSS